MALNILPPVTDRFRLHQQWSAAIATYDSILKFTPNAPDILLARGDVKASACDSVGADPAFPIHTSQKISSPGLMGKFEICRSVACWGRNSVHA